MNYEIQPTGEVMIVEGDSTELEVMKSQSKGTPIWFKYFDRIGSKERILVKNWVKYQKEKCTSYGQKRFLERVERALGLINYSYRIANIEPSRDNEGRLCYKEGESVCLYLNCSSWEEIVKAFAPDYGSDIASMYEVLLWYAYRIAKRAWTIYDVCDNLSIGNIWLPHIASGQRARAGIEDFGGARDGVGNTAKLAKSEGGAFVVIGGACGPCRRNTPVAEVKFVVHPNNHMDDTTAVVVLRSGDTL